MSTILFFDDTRLYNRTGFKRKYGEPERTEPEGSVSLPGHWPDGIWIDERGVYHMYTILRVERERAEHFYLLAYTSRDGDSWQPDNRAEEAGIAGALYPNQCFPYIEGYEVGYVYYDPRDVPERRLKALIAAYDQTNIRVDDIVYASPDGFKWTRLEGAVWNPRGAEPGLSCFYCGTSDSAVIVCRPTWGDRRICVAETKDFVNFTPPALAIVPDSEDPPLTEFYGMSAFAYKDYYIGFLWLYHTVSSNMNKYWGGRIDCQLAYSYNGTHWHRSLRHPFLPGSSTAEFAEGMIYARQLIRTADGSLKILGSGYLREHGHFTDPPGSIFSCKLREDGFVFLEADESGGTVFTRQLILRGGFSVNLDCMDGAATCAVYDHSANVIAGFGHENCRPCTGDFVSWVPEWEGHDISELRGRSVSIEIRQKRGGLYAINGDFQYLAFHESRRYQKFGSFEPSKGF